MIPAPPEPGTDLAARLAEVSGRSYDILHTSGIGGYLIPSEPPHLGAPGHARTLGRRGGQAAGAADDH